MIRNCFKIGEPWKYGVSGQFLFVEENNQFQWTNPTVIFDIDTNLALHIVIKKNSLLYNDINEQKNVFFSRQDYMPSVESFRENCQGGSYINIDFQVKQTTMESFYKKVVKVLLFLASKDFSSVDEKNVLESIYCVEVLSRFVIEGDSVSDGGKSSRRYSLRLWKSNQFDNFCTMQHILKVFSPEFNNEQNSDVLEFYASMKNIVNSVNNVCEKYADNVDIIKNRDNMIQKQKIPRLVSGQISSILSVDEIDSISTAVNTVPFKIKIVNISVRD
jgi:hypothetical protein